MRERENELIKSLNRIRNVNYSSISNTYLRLVATYRSRFNSSFVSEADVAVAASLVAAVVEKSCVVDLELAKVILGLMTLKD